jgi:3-dehydroquinate synthase
MNRHGAQLVAGLRSAGLVVHPILVGDGEALKSLGRIIPIYARLARSGLERGEAVIAFGGGSVGDTAGFVAATYLRGVPLVQIPSTLLAQVDSAIGGKTGVNLPQGKNLVGAIWQPRLVVCDTSLLATLPPRQIASGLAEVVKYGCIARPDLLERTERRLSRLLGRPSHIAATLVADCVSIKAKIVSHDERESDLRRILNFGHTWGHALERTAGPTTLTHGEAVALGMLVALELSVRREKLTRREADEVGALLKRIFPRLTFPDIPYAKLEGFLARDKKVARGLQVWILLRRLGAPVVRDGVPRDAIHEAVLVAAERWACT